MVQVLESNPQIPIHVSEIKKLMKDLGGGEVDGGGAAVDENYLLTVLHSGSSGRNPTFFKAFGHDDVFGLKSAIPPGAMEIPAQAIVGVGDSDVTTPSDVLYVQLPEGHPVITGGAAAAQQSQGENTFLFSGGHIKRISSKNGNFDRKLYCALI